MPRRAYDGADFNITSKYMEHRPCDVAGKWILDRRLGEPSMRGILNAMNLPQQTVESHVAKDESMDIMCHIYITDTQFKIRSFYIQSDENEARVEVMPLGKEIVEGTKKTLVKQESKSRVVMKRSMSTVCGFSEYEDSKEVVKFDDAVRAGHVPEEYTENPAILLQQIIKVENHEWKKQNTAIRYYVPVDP